MNTEDIMLNKISQSHPVVVAAAFNPNAQEA